MTQITCSKPLVGIVLFLSLMANVFMGGMLVGKGGVAGDGLGLKIGKAIEAFRDLPPETREKAREAVKKEWPALKEQLGAVRAKRDAVKQILLQPEYKEEDLDKAMEAVRAEINKLVDMGQTLGKGIMRDMKPEDRQKFLKNLPSPPAE